MTLESIANYKLAKVLVSQIVNVYTKTKKVTENKQNDYISDPGIIFNNVMFMDVENICKPKFWYVNLRLGLSGQITIGYNIKQTYNNELTTDEYFQHLKSIRANIIEQITLLNWLHKSGLIFFIEDKKIETLEFQNSTKDDDARYKEIRDRFSEDNKFYFEEKVQSEILSDFLLKYYGCRIIPSPQLIDLKRHRFKTPEQRRHSCTVILSLIGIATAIFIAIYSNKHPGQTTLKETQLQTILNAIPQNNNEVTINHGQLDSIKKVIQENKQNTTYNGKAENAKP